MGGTVGGWDQYYSNYLKAEHVRNDSMAFVCIGVEEREDGTSKKLELELMTNVEGLGETKFLFTLNKKNTTFLINNKISHPKHLIGKKLYFRIEQVMNRKTSQMVPGLIISRIE